MGPFSMADPVIPFPLSPQIRGPRFGTSMSKVRSAHPKERAKQARAFLKSARETNARATCSLSINQKWIEGAKLDEIFSSLAK